MNRDRSDIIAQRARCLGGTFGRLIAATPNLTGAERLRLAEALSDERWASGWARLGEQLEGERVLDGVLTLRRRRPMRAAGLRRPASPPRMLVSGEDVLDTIPPPEYVEALIGEPVPYQGGAICCPFPDHEDRTPSFHVYPDPSEGFYCFGCHRGGSVIDLAAALTGIEPRGEGFHEVRRYIAERLLGTAA